VDVRVGLLRRKQLLVNGDARRIAIVVSEEIEFFVRMEVGTIEDGTQTLR
jgi:hypothetical protein